MSFKSFWGRIVFSLGILGISFMLMVGVFSGVSFADSEEAGIEALSVQILFFYGEGCPHCARGESFLDELEQENAVVEVNRYETYFDQENRELFEDVVEGYGTEIEGVPMTFINDKVFVGFSSSIQDQIEKEVDFCLSFKCENPLNKIEADAGERDLDELDGGVSKELTIVAVISAAAVDAINPCAFAVLIILLTTILATKSRKRALFAGLAFACSIFISYFLMGWGLYTAIQAAQVTRVFYIIVAVLAILVGLFNLKDYFWYGKWFIMEVPRAWRPKMKVLIRGVTSVPGAFLIGFVVSLFLLPCTSGPYIVILGLLAEATERAYAVSLLVLYNLVFVLPMLVITGAVYFGFTSTDKAEQWRKSKLKVLHLIAGLIILALGIGMFVAMGMGML